MKWRAVTGVLLAGILADAFAKTDEDVDRGVSLYEDGDYEGAVEAFEAAEERRGERPEIFYDKGLALMELDRLEEAKTAFERGIESDDARVRASSFYELGNLAFDAEDWEAAIAAYKDCLRTDPNHENAKWNLEVAMERLRQEQEEQEKEQSEEEQEQEGEQGEQEQEDDQEQDGEEQEQDEEQQDGQEGDEEQEQDGQQQDESEGEQEQQEGDEQEQEGEQGEDGEEQEQQEQQPKNEPGEQEQQEQQPGEPQAGEAIDASDIDAQLEQLDEQDDFIFGVPQGKTHVDKDW